ncbi:MAG: serine hydrolase domain-containing protein [Rhodanobacter sp.]
MRHLPIYFAIAATCLLPASAWAERPATKASVTNYTEHMMADFYRADAPGAAVLVARGDEVLYRGARGLADVKTGARLTPDAVFRIGSISKQFAAAGVLKLVKAGKLSLADPLSKFVPGFPNGKHITVLELLNHTSGIKDYTRIARWADGPLDKPMSTAQLITTFKNAKPDFSPGTDWAYDNSGYVLVGAVIEAVTGQPWYVYLSRTLFEPLGMTHTGYGADPKFAAQQAHGYSLKDGKVVPAKVISMAIPSAAGGLVSTVDDLLKWNRALHEGRVLKSATYTQMITPVGKAVDANYGFGIERTTVQGQPMLEHDGGIFGFESMLEYVPGQDISVVVLQNNDSNDDYKGPDTIARKLAAAALGQPYPESTPIAVTVATLKQSEGVYRIDPNTARVLRVVDGKLTAQRTGGQRSALIPIGTDEFLYRNGLDRFTVQRDAAGTVTGMLFFARGEPPGTLVARTKEPLPNERQEVPLPDAALNRVLGTYAAGGMTMKVFWHGTQLVAQMGGQAPIEIFAESSDLFFMTAVDATLAFSTGKEPPATVTLSEGGHTMTLQRLP